LQLEADFRKTRSKAEPLAASVGAIDTGTLTGSSTSCRPETGSKASAVIGSSSGSIRVGVGEGELVEDGPAEVDDRLAEYQRRPRATIRGKTSVRKRAREAELSDIR
jgi:hypothetical protein